MSVLRSKGYDGASLNELASSSGLKKASLYHRFPKGKQEIAAAVLTFVAESIETDIYKVLADRSVKPKNRLNKVLQNIDDNYNAGEATCILRALSLDSGLELFGDEIKLSMDKWIDGFTVLGMDMGYKKAEAESKAYRTLILVQGSLIVSKAVGSVEPFQQILVEIKGMYK